MESIINRNWNPSLRLRGVNGANQACGWPIGNAKCKRRKITIARRRAHTNKHCVTSYITIEIRYVWFVFCKKDINTKFIPHSRKSINSVVIIYLLLLFRQFFLFFRFLWPAMFDVRWYGCVLPEYSDWHDGQWSEECTKCVMVVAKGEDESAIWKGHENQ